MLEKVKKFLLYYGNDHVGVELVTPKIRQTNRITVAIITFTGAILILGMFISTFFVEGVQSNRVVYAVGTVMSLLISLIALFYAKNHPKIVMPLVYISYFIFYMYGILIGTITDPGQKTVTFVVTLVLLPVLFIDRPLNVIFTTSVYEFIFIYLCLKNKTGAVLQNDIIDAIVFGILGLISGAMANQTKIHGYILEHKLQEVSQFDRLTQMNNRNAYELCLEDIQNHANGSLACIYIDVNGLHELNNAKGHAYGDEMLKTIAEEIQSHFGEEFSFRIGGDEFVVFAPDMSKASIEQNLKGLVKNVEKKGYHLAVGFEIMSVRYLSMEELIKTAESKMYESKKQFYENRAYDRRRRN